MEGEGAGLDQIAGFEFGELAPERDQPVLPAADARLGRLAVLDEQQHAPRSQHPADLILEELERIGFLAAFAASGATVSANCEPDSRLVASEYCAAPPDRFARKDPRLQAARPSAGVSARQEHRSEFSLAPLARFAVEPPYPLRTGRPTLGQRKTAAVPGRAIETHFARLREDYIL